VRVTRRFAVLFVIWQGIGLLGALTWNLPKSTAAQWVIGFLCLLPGNIVASRLVEDMVWTRVSMQMLTLTVLLATVGINLGFWLLVREAIQRLARITARPSRRG
jgi:hypothetical protein